MTPEEKQDIRWNLLQFSDEDWELWIQSMIYVSVHYPHLKTFYLEGIWRADS